MIVVAVTTSSSCPSCNRRSTSSVVVCEYYLRLKHVVTKGKLEQISLDKGIVPYTTLER